MPPKGSKGKKGKGKALPSPVLEPPQLELLKRRWILNTAMMLTLQKSKKERGQWSVGAVNIPVAIQSRLKS